MDSILPLTNYLVKAAMRSILKTYSNSMINGLLPFQITMFEAQRALSVVPSLICGNPREPLVYGAWGFYKKTPQKNETKHEMVKEESIMQNRKNEPYSLITSS